MCSVYSGGKKFFGCFLYLRGTVLCQEPVLGLQVQFILVHYRTGSFNKKTRVQQYKNCKNSVLFFKFCVIYNKQFHFFWFATDADEHNSLANVS